MVPGWERPVERMVGEIPTPRSAGS